MQLGLRNIEGGLCRRLVARLDRALDILDEGAHAAQSRAVGRGALLGLPKTLLGGFVVRHWLSSKAGVRLISARAVMRQLRPINHGSRVVLEIGAAQAMDVRSTVLKSGL